jgi:hypothetical protein
MHSFCPSFISFFFSFSPACGLAMAKKSVVSWTQTDDRLTLNKQPPVRDRAAASWPNLKIVFEFQCVQAR